MSSIDPTNVPTSCPLCGAKVPTADCGRQRPSHHRCGRCRTALLLTSDASTAYPDEYYGSDTAKFSGAAGKMRRLWHRRRAHRLLQLCAGSARPSIYDLGCGDGEFLAACRQLGFSVSGCEPIERPRQQAAQRLDRDIDAVAFAGDACQRYDFITAWQVIEHVPDPAGFLRTAHAHLATDGILAVSTVNIDSLQAAIFGSQWLHLDPPRHLWAGTRSAVEALVERCEYEIIARVWNHLEFGPVGYVDSAFNLIDGRRDRLLHCLKNGFPGVANKCLWLAAAALTPIGIAMSALETALGKSATFELYARQRAANDSPSTPAG